MLRLSGGSLLLINLVIYCKLSIICKQAALAVVFVLFRWAGSWKVYLCLPGWSRWWKVLPLAVGLGEWPQPCQVCKMQTRKAPHLGDGA